MRTYLIFGSADGTTWQALGAVNADSHDQARETAAEQVPGHEHYGSCPFRNWRSGTPETRTIRSWTTFDITSIPGQLTVDDMIDEPDEEEQPDELLDRAKAQVEKVKEQADEE